MFKITTLRVAAALIFIAAFNLAAQSRAKTVIAGEISNIPSAGLQLFVEEDLNRKKSRLVATIEYDRAGRFRLERDLPSHIYTLRTGGGKSAVLAIRTGQSVFVTGDAGGPERLEVTGSDDTAKLEAYEEFRKASLARLVGSVRQRITRLRESGTPASDRELQELSQLEIENYVRHKDELIGFVKREMGTSVAIYQTSIRWDGEKNLPFLTELAKRFEAAHGGTDVAQRVNEKVRTLAGSGVGGVAAPIEMPDKDGVKVRLSSMKARYILIDFWGSWCPPCRHESPILVDLYQRFKGAGFEIYGVGLESNRDLWLKAIQQDKRTWTNVSTFQEFGTPAAFDYAVTSLPANVLIDSSGKIIRRNLHGNELVRTIAGLFDPSALD
jgi:thiol-disulfide isomerase/thioredoxin